MGGIRRLRFRAAARNLAFALLLLASLAWIGALIAAPSFARRGFSHRAASRTVYAVGRALCHQDPGRSFHSSGVPWPVCARCAGLYLSAPIGIGLAWLAWAVPGTRRRPTAMPWRAALVACSVPTVVTILVEWSRFTEVSNLARAVSAAPLGAGVAALVASTIAGAGGASSRGPATHPPAASLSADPGIGRAARTDARPAADAQAGPARQ